MRLRPRSDATQRLEAFELSLEPEPAGRTDSLELEGNSAVYAWFSGMHDSLIAKAVSETVALRRNPFDFILPEISYTTLPFDYPEPWDERLEPFRVRETLDDDVNDLARELMRGEKRSTQGFLNAACADLHERIEKVTRLEGEPFTPGETLRKGRGACRDTAMLFNDLCRSVGLAARFASGYHAGDPDKPERDLHAWSEVFLPGAGWRGFDPTHGLAVADRHIALAAGPTPAEAAPSAGTFRGTEAESSMSYSVRIQVDED